MGKATGRKRKPGRRTESGSRPSRAGIVQLIDRGSDWVRAMQERYGQDYSSALGRAYVSGLLGEDDTAKMRYDAAKKFIRIRKRVFGHRGARCPLDQTPRGHSFTPDHEQDLADQQWLYDAMDSMEQCGGARYLDQMMSCEHTDGGPLFLDHILQGRGTDSDRAKLTSAIEALDVIAPERAFSQIRVAAA